MLKKKMSFVLAFVFMLVLTVNNIFAVDIFDTKLTENVYKLSEDESEFIIPFFRLSEQRMELDRSIDQIGLFMTNATIDVSAPQKGIQMFYTNDTVRVNSSMEYAVILSTGNVVINEDIEKTVLVYCNGTLTIGENANVKGNIIACTPTMNIDGIVEGNILGSVHTLNVNNSVNGKIKLEIYNVVLGENAKVSQEMEFNTTNTQLKIDENKAKAKIDIIEVQKASVGDYIIKILKVAITGFATYLLILILAKKERINKIMTKLDDAKILKAGLSGYLGLIMAICFGVVVLAVVAELGIAAIIFSSAVMLILTLLKNVIVGYLIVHLVDNKYKDLEVKPNSIIVAIATFLMLSLLENIPIVGGIVSFIVFIISLGMIITLIKKSLKKDEVQQQEIIEAK